MQANAKLGVIREKCLLTILARIHTCCLYSKDKKGILRLSKDYKISEVDTRDTGRENVE